MNFTTTIDLPNELATERMAQLVAENLKPPLILTFSGDIGAGKTTLIRAMLRNLGINAAIKSPTFSLVESYQINHLQIHHFDLYRIHDEVELDFIGFRDYFSADAVCCIEWPERAGNYLTDVDISFIIDLQGDGRTMRVSAFSPAGVTVLSCLAGT